LKSMLSGLLRPDLLFAPAATEIGFVHRKTEDADIYFVANASNSRQQLKATFRIQGKHAEWWDPIRGRISAAPTQLSGDQGTTLGLDLEPYGSRVVVFSKRTLPPRRISRTSHLPPALDLSTGWQVAFGENRPVITMDHLQSWTDGEATRFFSGQATYEKSF